MINFKKNKNKILSILHILGFTILVILTFYGVYQIREENFENIKKVIVNRWELFFIACILRLFDWVLDYYLWRCMLKNFYISIPFVKSIWVYLTQGAGIVLPAQIGRALRGYIIAKTTGATISRAMTVEFLFLVCVCEGAFLVVLISLGVYANTFVLPIILSILSLFIFPFLLKLFKPFLAKIKIVLTEDLIRFSFLTLFCIGCAIGWAINGLIFYLLLGGKESGLYLSQIEMIVLANLFLAMCSGIPGGIGIVEATMGVSLHWLQVQLPEIILVIGLFRIMTFWIWIPFGWLALFRLKLYRSVDLKVDME